MEEDTANNHLFYMFLLFISSEMNRLLTKQHPSQINYVFYMIKITLIKFHKFEKLSKIYVLLPLKKNRSDEAKKHRHYCPC